VRERVRLEDLEELDVREVLEGGIRGDGVGSGEGSGRVVRLW